MINDKTIEDARLDAELIGQYSHELLEFIDSAEEQKNDCDDFEDENIVLKSLLKMLGKRLDISENDIEFMFDTVDKDDWYDYLLGLLNSKRKFKCINS